MAEQLVNKILNSTIQMDVIQAIFDDFEIEKSIEMDRYNNDEFTIKVNKSIDKISSIAIFPRQPLTLDETKIQSSHQFKDTLSMARLAGNEKWLCISASKKRDNKSDLIFIIPHDNITPHLLMLSREGLINFQTEAWIRNIYQIQVAA